MCASQRRDLRLVTLVHDTFKYAEDKTEPRDWTQHHGVLARRFVERYSSTRRVVELRRVARRGLLLLAPRRALPPPQPQSAATRSTARPLRRGSSTSTTVFSCVTRARATRTLPRLGGSSERPGLSCPPGKYNVGCAPRSCRRRCEAVRSAVAGSAKAPQTSSRGRSNDVSAAVRRNGGCAHS